MQAIKHILMSRLFVAATVAAGVLCGAQLAAGGGDLNSAWMDAGRTAAIEVAGALVAVCFVVFNAVRIFLYVPQLLTCCRDTAGCPSINLLTWSSWIVANASTGLYMWIFLGDAWGLLLNLGNALMCAATVAVTVAKRRRSGTSAGQGAPTARPAAGHVIG